MNWQTQLIDAEATVALGRRVAKACEDACVIYLEGELGAGKTTLTRGFMEGRGHTGKVKSPTYTLVEPYQLGPWRVHHFDLYRLSDPEELEFIGIRDYFADDCQCLVEWAERGEGCLPKPDVIISLSYEGESRRASLLSQSPRGEVIVSVLASLA